MSPTLSMSPRADALFHEHCRRIYRQTDRVFAGLMVVQFIAGIIFALVISPRTWAGTTSSVHPHLIAALMLGGAIAVLPICLVALQPGRLFTRLVVAIAQMSTSALLIHLTGGRIETHFHVFGSLAFLAFYRDWRVFVPATIVIALDHLLRGLFWPESVYGVLNAPIWRSLEHAGWVAFEDVFLILACVRATREMKDIARTRAQLEETNALIESKVVERTAELAAQHKTLQETHVQLMHASRRAGMAEIASGVLHNVGNVLNSVNVSASLATDRVRKLKLESLSKAAAMIRAHDADLGRFVTEDEKGRLIPSFLEKVSQNLLSDQNSIIQELAGLSQSIEHIKAIVSTQQTYARSAGLIERLNVRDIVEDALRMHTASFARHGIRIIREFNEVPSIEADKHQLLQILLNLLSNARHAMHEQTDRAKLLTLRIAGVEDACVQVEIADTGVGIAPENLQRIFAHGFTTKTDGHGFGLHASANAARQMGGTLKALSDGMNRGATFILEFPISKTEAVV